MNERPSGECPVDIQANEPLVGG